jgi:tRNA uridine 5-carboxymethylaminomethyl modification enzyme
MEVQWEIVHSIPGLDKAEMLRPGYAIEYDAVDATELDRSLRVKCMEGLYLAGQINGTSGYEEAACQGIMAGINAALHVKGEAPFTMDRSEGYTGILIDDLISKGTNEPYRMFTSRAEFRLHLRIDNADRRLTPYGRKLGLIGDADWAAFERKQARMVALSELLAEMAAVLGRNSGQSGKAGTTVLRNEARAVETEIKFAGYLEQQKKSIEKLKAAEALAIPAWLDYSIVSGLSREMREILERVRPVTIGQASRIPGVTPAALSLVHVSIRIQGAKPHAAGLTSPNPGDDLAPLRQK